MDPVDGVTDREDVVGERAVQPAGLVAGVAEVDHPGIDALGMQTHHRRRAR